MNIGNTIKKLRLKADLTQKDLGELIGVTQQYIAKLEKGGNSPTVSTLKKLSLVLNASVYDLLDTELREQEQNNSNIDEQKEMLLNNYYKLNSDGKDEAIKRVAELTELKKYTK